MTIKQISVFLENRPGTLAEATDVLYRGGVNMRALNLADTRDFGILRLIVDRREQALALLEQAGFATVETDVLAAVLPDEPGALAAVLDILAAVGVSVEYAYASLTQWTDCAVVVLRVDDTEFATAELESYGIHLADEELFGQGLHDQ